MDVTAVAAADGNAFRAGPRPIKSEEEKHSSFLLFLLSASDAQPFVFS